MVITTTFNVMSSSCAYFISLNLWSFFFLSAQCQQNPPCHQSAQDIGQVMNIKTEDQWLLWDPSYILKHWNKYFSKVSSEEFPHSPIPEASPPDNSQRSWTCSQEDEDQKDYRTRPHASGAKQMLHVMEASPDLITTWMRMSGRSWAWHRLQWFGHIIPRDWIKEDMRKVSVTPKDTLYWIKSRLTCLIEDPAWTLIKARK